MNFAPESFCTILFAPVNATRIFFHDIARHGTKFSHVQCERRRLADQSEVKVPSDVVREIRLAVPAASASTEKGETIPDAFSSIAIMATAIADRKAV